MLAAGFCWLHRPSAHRHSLLVLEVRGAAGWLTCGLVLLWLGVVGVLRLGRWCGACPHFYSTILVLLRRFMMMRVGDRRRGSGGFGARRGAARVQSALRAREDRR